MKEKKVKESWLSVGQSGLVNNFRLISRRKALKCLAVLPAVAYGCTSGGKQTNTTTGLTGGETPDDVPVVYMTREITPAALLAMYEKLGRKATGKVAVKLSMGEPGGHNYLKPELVGDLVRLVNGTIVDCNTAYGGNRATTELHLKAAEDHGFTAIAPIDIMDTSGEIELPVTGGRHLTKDIVGANFPTYDFVVNLSHFKGHAMGGFGGALKNLSIGIASSKGKTYIHSAGTSTTDWGNPEQNDFLESMAEAAQAILAHCGERIIHISVMNNLSVDCDCDASPEDPQMADIGILASLDPVALDKACVDQVYNSPDPGKSHLIERMESRNGIRIVEHAEALGMGKQQYKLQII